MMMSDRDHMERNAKYLSRPEDEEDKYKLVGKMLYVGYLTEERKRHERYLKNKLIQSYEFISYLNEQELMLVGELDREEAKSLYNRSQKKGYKCLSLLGRLEKKKFRERMMGLTVEDEDEEFIYPESDDEGAFQEAKSYQNDVGTKIIYYNDQGRKELVEMVKSYQMKLEKVNQILKKRKLIE